MSNTTLDLPRERIAALVGANDELVVGAAVEARDAAEELEAEAGSHYRWLMADAFLELNNRGWTQKRISGKCGMSQPNVSFYVQAAREYYPGNNRPTFAFAYKEAKGEKLDPLHSSDSDEWETPQALYDLLNAEFDFELDVCATSENAKAPRHLAEGGLEEDWSGLRCWMNPPYSEINQWMRKAHEASKQKALVVCLVPARTDTTWWWTYARQGEVRFLRGRLKFGGGRNSAPFPSAVVVFGRQPCLRWWDEWPTE